MSTEPAIVGDARRICEEANANGVQVRLLGGIAIWLRSPEPCGQVSERATTIASALEEAPKSRGWRRRARIEQRMKWYQTPDEV